MSYLSNCDRSFSPKQNLLRDVFKHPGYHSRIPNGSVVHMTVPSLRYALALLQAGDGSLRAGAIIRAVLQMQDTDVASSTYGVWPWFLEEPLTAMSQPDWNWADFCGELLGTMIVDHADALPAELVADMKEALGHAGWAIFRRNSNPAYTNIALLGGVAAGAAVASDGRSIPHVFLAS